MRDTMIARGPDGAGLRIERNVALGHRRLAIIAPGPDGDQPMSSSDGRWCVAYNGELYNDDELRAELRASGLPLPLRGDTATIVSALEAWGLEALSKLRGMYAIAVHDRQQRSVHLFRDPFGIKPLYWSFDGTELVFASDLRALLRHPRVAVAPDLEGVSGYLTNLRTNLGQRTLFRGVHCLEPGMQLNLRTDVANFRPRLSLGAEEPPLEGIDPRAAADQLREVLADSVQRHLWSDRPSAVLLSGGLDSALIAALAAESGDRPTAFVAGCEGEGPEGDRAQAAEVARELGLDLREVSLDQATFLRGWSEMVNIGGMPISTPNEVAIRALARAMAAEGRVVALGGEGADELFGGYGAVMDAAQTFESVGAPGLGAGRFHLEACAWVAPAAKAEILSPYVWDVLNDDAALIESSDRLFELGRRELGPEADPLEAHLRYLRRVNLTGLLERLDRSTMLASVEGRVPFADRRVRAFADALPMAYKYGPAPALVGGGGSSDLRPQGPAPRTKLVVRDAARGLVGERVLQRPKTSFPLPMQRWIADSGSILRDSPFATALFQPEAIERVASDPSAHWTHAWPMLNLAQWGDRWF